MTNYRMIDGRVYRKRGLPGELRTAQEWDVIADSVTWTPLNLDDPDNADVREAWDEWKRGCYDFDYNGKWELPPDGLYRLVKRECEKCDGAFEFWTLGSGRRERCPACANNVEPGYVRFLERCEDENRTSDS